MSKVYKHIFFLFALVGFLAISLYTQYDDYRKKKLSGFSSDCEKMARLALDDFHKTYEGQDVIIIGDSRMAQWPSYIIQRHLPGLTFFNFAVSGDVSRQTLCRVQLVSKELSKKAIILQVGINDLVAISMLSNREKLERNQLESATFKNISLISEIFTPSNKVFVLSIVPPIDTDMIRALVWGGGIRESAQAVSSRVGQLPSIEFVDVSHVFYDENKKNWRSEFSADALHWNHSAYESITQLMYSTHLEHLIENTVEARLQKRQGPIISCF